MAAGFEADKEEEAAEDTRTVAELCRQWRIVKTKLSYDIALLPEQHPDADLDNLCDAAYDAMRDIEAELASRKLLTPDEIYEVLRIALENLSDEASTIVEENDIGLLRAVRLGLAWMVEKKGGGFSPRRRGGFFFRVVFVGGGGRGGGGKRGAKNFFRKKTQRGMSLFAAGTASAAGSNPLADAVRKANDRFQDVSVAVKRATGPSPAIAVQWAAVWASTTSMATYLKDGVLDIAKPEAVMYEPMPDGKLALIGVEYIALKGPASLEGHQMNYNSTPNSYGLPEFYEIHVWAWKANPMGTFADDNPDVSCDALPLPAK